jgi:hypothetical protein
MPPHPTRSALPRPGIDRNRLIGRRPRRPNLPGQLEHPGPQLGGILDPVPRAVAGNDEAMRRVNPQNDLAQSISAPDRRNAAEYAPVV